MFTKLSARPLHLSTCAIASEKMTRNQWRSFSLLLFWSFFVFSTIFSFQTILITFFLHLMTTSLLLHFTMTTTFHPNSICVIINRVEWESEFATKYQPLHLQVFSHPEFFLEQWQSLMAKEQHNRRSKKKKPMEVFGAMAHLSLFSQSSAPFEVKLEPSQTSKSNISTSSAKIILMLKILLPHRPRHLILRNPYRRLSSRTLTILSMLKASVASMYRVTWDFILF